MKKLGGKAASLIWLRENGFSPPRFSVFGVTCWENALRQRDDILDLMGKLEYASDQFSVKVLSATLRSKVKDLDLPRAAVDQIEEEFMEGKYGKCVVVRSSAESEDMASMSSAGQYETVLGLSASEEVIDAVKTVLASYYTDRAVAYRRAYGISQVGLEMAVVVQEMIIADVSGVAFSRDPLGDYSDACIIDASWGIGHIIVSGAVQPDNFVVSRDGLKILRKKLGTKRYYEDFDTNLGKIVRRQRTGENAFCLSDDQVRELAAEVIRAEDLRGIPVDLEWVAVHDGADYDFTFVQVRPITNI